MKLLDIAVKNIQAAGFSHFKVELEAQLYRSNSDGRRACEMCDGRGRVDTEETRTDGSRVGMWCPGCDGDGRITDPTRNFNSVDTCKAFILANISTECKRSITYSKFYNDGSVDSEYTFTMPIAKAHLVTEVIEAFNKLAAAIGRVPEVDGAGMHISVLTSGRYPSGTRLPAENLQNFQREVTKLLPALFVAATSGNFTRSFRYRYPRIDHGDKYSAIYTHDGTCLEYRLFETCYQRPEAIFEYLGVIAKTLEFYRDTTKRVPELGSRFPVYERMGLKGFTELPEQISVIKKTFRHIKPEGITIKQFMNDREITLLITQARNRDKSQVSEIKKAYREHVRAHNARVGNITQYHRDNLEYWRRERPGQNEDWYFRQVFGFSKDVEDEATFISKNLRRATPSLQLAV